MGIYVLKVTSNSKEYIKIDGNIANIRIPIMKSEVHLLTKERVVFDILDSGGREIPDFLYHEGILLVSDRVKEFFDSKDMDYFFYKEAILQSKSLSIYERFWIVVPPRIDCVDMSKCEINLDSYDYLNGIIPMFECENILLSEKLIGRFTMFKVLGVLDNNIYVTNNLNEEMMKNFSGVCFVNLQ